MTNLYFMFFALPAIVGILLLLVARREGEVSMKGGLLLGSWYALGFFFQYFGRSPTSSVVGLVMLTALAVFLGIKLRIGF
jgi:hypothetical protein